MPAAPAPRSAWRRTLDRNRGGGGQDTPEVRNAAVKKRLHEIHPCLYASLFYRFLCAHIPEAASRVVALRGRSRRRSLPRTILYIFRPTSRRKLGTLGLATRVLDCTGHDGVQRPRPCASASSHHSRSLSGGLCCSGGAIYTQHTGNRIHSVVRHEQPKGRDPWRHSTLRSTSSIVLAQINKIPQ